MIGTTLATNARLQKRGATVLYIGTSGVEDVPIIARIDRKEAYNPAWPKPDSGVKAVTSLVSPTPGPQRQRLLPFETGRIGSARQLGSALAQGGTRDRLGNRRESPVLLREPGSRARDRRLSVQAISRFADLIVPRVAPIWREYERATTVITDAFIKRTITQFSGRLASAVKKLGIKAPLSLRNQRRDVRPPASQTPV